MNTSTPLSTTRRALHAVAEHVLAADLHAHIAKIGLRATFGGFGQPEHIVDGVRRRVRIDGTELVVLTGDTEQRAPLTTLAAAASAARAPLGAPTDVFTPTTPLAPDTPLVVDADAAALLARCFATANEAIERFRRDHASEGPTIAQLWPEHFDLACSMSEINFGVSPGDDEHPDPYVYVGPWAPATGAFWNEPWGHSTTWTPAMAADDIVACFEAGLAQARRG